MNRRVTMKVLSPVHIGSGDVLSPSEYFFHQEKCHIINIRSLINDAEFKPHFETYLNNSAKHIPVNSYISNDMLLKHVLYKTDVVGDAVDKLANNALSINTIIKSAGSAVIPGSAIKGSVLSAMTYAVLKEECENNRAMRTKVENTLRHANRRRRFNKKDDVWDNKELMKFVMPKLGQRGANNFTSWLRITDSNLLDVSEVVEIRLAEVEGARTSTKLPIIYEAIKAGTTFTVEVDDSLCTYNWENIIDILIDFYNGVYELDDYGMPYQNWDADEESILLRLGQGSTAFATSLLVLADELNIHGYTVKKPRTRKRIDGIPMGWVEVIDE